MKTQDKKKTSTVAIVTALVIVGSMVTSARAAGMLVADGGFGGVLEIQSHEVVVTINNGIAVTEVTQEFRNTEDRIVEALYTFPVPKGASVANFSMWINGKEMTGEVLEKKRARQIYESYKQTRKDPGLLEQTDYKTFEMRIFPIAARAVQKVKIRYYQEFQSDHDWVTYVYPLATAATERNTSQTTGKFSFTMHATSAVPIVQMQSPSHKDDFVMVKHGDSYYQASLETTGGNLNRDVVLSYKLQRPVTGVDMLYSKADREDGYFCLTLTAGQELADKNGPMDYVILLDISGSMADESKLKISRQCIQAFVDELGPEDRFELMTFNVKPDMLFNQLTQADSQSKTAVGKFLGSRRAGGGTVLLPALQTAYKYRTADRPLNVIVFSDGMTQQSERLELLRAIQKRPSNAKVFCVGVGNEINRDLLSHVAEDAGGLAAFLSRGDDFKRQAAAFRRKLVRPAINNLQIKVDGAGVYDIEPQKLPNLFHGQPVRIYGRYRKGGNAKITLAGEISGSDFTKSMQLGFPKRADMNPEIRRMWALKKIQRLNRQIEKTGKTPALVDEIIRLGEGHSIVTEYTSFIVLENDAEYKRWKIERRNELLVKRDRKSHQRLLDQLEQMRGDTMADLGPKEAKAEQVAVNTNQPSPTSNNRGFDVDINNGSNSTNRSGRRFGGGGGGPVGPIGLVIIGGLVGGECLRRRKADRCR